MYQSHVESMVMRAESLALRGSGHLALPSGQPATWRRDSRCEVAMSTAPRGVAAAYGAVGDRKLAAHLPSVQPAIA